jgi:hypothetical protein
MKKVKKICALILALVIAVSLCACEEESGMSKVEEALQGDWECTWAYVAGTCYYYFHFDNGLVTSSFKSGFEEQQAGTYTVNEEAQQITCTWDSYSCTQARTEDYSPSPTVFDYTYENGTLSLNISDSEIMVFHKLE